MKTIFKFLKPYKGLIVMTLFVMIMEAAGALLIPKLTAEMINIGVGSGNMELILRNGIFMMVVTVVAGAGALLGSYLCACLSAKVGRDMRNAIYDKSLTLSASDFEQFGTGSMITRTLNDINIIQQSIVWCIQMVLPVPVLCIIGIFMAFSIDNIMGALLLVSTLMIIILAILVTRRASMIFGKLQRFLDRMNIVLRENITGVRVIRAFNKESGEERRTRKSFEDYAEYAIKANRLFAGLESSAFFLLNMCIVAILWIGANRIGTGHMLIGDITALTEYAIIILFYIIMAQMVIILLPRAQVCTKRLREVLEFEPEIIDRNEKASLEAPNTEKVIEFKNATFKFADADEDTLGNLSFVCKRGQTTAIIGGTGSGKSTIAKLLLRFHDLTSGTILLNGMDIRQMTQKNLRSHIAYVPQKAWLFSGTIEDNLRHGNAEATEEDMRHALTVAQSQFVEKLPKGLEAPVSQGGTNFSGGQKQRLAIARALMKKADLYIFDDSFSALDFKTDAALRKALFSETKNSAVLIIAQRVSTILNAEQIIVLEDGKIAGIGNHKALMESCQVYRDIAKSQMKGGKEDGKE